jgi:SAM-dependent methyltransferase
LLRQTTLHQAAWALKFSMLHIDTDSGLVHMAQAVHTKALVMFGPTDAALYSHDGNIVLRAGTCGECWWSTPDWLSRCPRGLPSPACMEAIAPALVVAEAVRFLQSQPSDAYELTAAALYDTALLQSDASYLRDIFEMTGLAPVPISAHARGEDTGLYLHASKQWEYLFAATAIRAVPPPAGTPLRILDAGGGRGALPAYLAALGHDVEVIDRDFLWDHGGDMDIERRYMRSAGAKNIRIRYGSVYNLPAASESFDVVTCISVIEHLHNKHLVLDELLRVLRPDGILVLSFDIAAAPEAFEDHLRVEIFSPARLADFLAGIGVAMPVFAALPIGESAEVIQNDGVAGIPPGMTVGGIVLRKDRKNLV